MNSPRPETACCLCIDVGTTNSRVWLVSEGDIVYRQSEMVGVRDTARDGNNARLRSSLAKMIGGVREHAMAGGYAPTEILGAGMITSALGLVEIPHIKAPVGVAELRAGALHRTFPEICDLPFVLMPGVATVGADAENNDVMRGEEVLCVGLKANGVLENGGTVLNLGSHWKVISLARDGVIAESYTTISGELLFAAQANTVLRSSLPTERPMAHSIEWLRRGYLQERRRGLMRACFSVRLLDLAKEGSPEERSSYLLGAFIASTLSGIKGHLHQPLVLTGEMSVAAAWKAILADNGIESRLLGGPDLESAYVSGLSYIRKSAS